MWLERFESDDNPAIFYVFCAVAFCICVLAVAGMASPCYMADSSPGNSLSFFVNLSTMIIAMTVLFRGINATWSNLDTYSTICMIYVPSMVLGCSLFAICLLAKLTTTISVFRRTKNLRGQVRYSEWRSTILIWLTMLLASVIALVWILMFSPEAYEQDSSDSSAVSSYECTGSRTTSDGSVADKDSVEHTQFIWRVSCSVFFVILLFAALVQILLLCRVKMPRMYRPSVAAYSLTIVNTWGCIIAGMAIWFIRRKTPDGVDFSMEYLIIGGLELWVALFANIMILVGTGLTSRRCRLEKLKMDEPTHMNLNFSRLDLNTVSPRELAASPLTPTSTIALHSTTSAANRATGPAGRPASEPAGGPAPGSSPEPMKGPVSHPISEPAAGPPLGRPSQVVTNKLEEV